MDATKITTPTLVIRGDGDFFADPGLFNALTGVKTKKDVLINDATHWVLYEKHR
ncbi:MAG TPA: alpha/beta hydrolase, partial [Paenibacillaceae bacterium]|nr:alpha/beta hydrolase [Paenibacillaceae bacterium]